MALAGLVLTTACSEAPLRGDERFQSLSLDTKKTFLAYYPVLSPEQRKLFLESDDRFSLLHDWKLDTLYFAQKDKDSDAPPFFNATPKNFTVAELRITTDPPADIRQGKEVVLKSEVEFQDGRKADSTADTDWDVKPDLASIEDGNHLRFECIHSDVIVTGDFIGEHSRSRVVSIRKPIQKLEVFPDAAFNAVAQTSGWIQLKVIARCEDGTSANVTCQADWEGLGSHACGRVDLSPIRLRAPSDDSPVTIRARYGDREASYQVRDPRLGS
jgi:hypothetical protein